MTITQITLSILYRATHKLCTLTASKNKFTVLTIEKYNNNYSNLFDILLYSLCNYWDLPIYYSKRHLYLMSLMSLVLFYTFLSFKTTDTSELFFYVHWLTSELLKFPSTGVL